VCDCLVLDHNKGFFFSWTAPRGVLAASHKSKLAARARADRATRAPWRQTFPAEKYTAPLDQLQRQLAAMHAEQALCAALAGLLARQAGAELWELLLALRRAPALLGASCGHVLKRLGLR
jgi:L-alanine-DL-glutamate epimerase-like enolase superfamily enzyme